MRIVTISGYNPMPWTVGTISIGRKGGKTFPRVSKSGQLRAYQEGLNEDVTEAMEVGKFIIPTKGTQLQVEMFFWRQREQTTNANGRKTTRQRADATNLGKSTEDAMQGVLYHNDVDNRSVFPTIIEQERDTEPLIIVVVRKWDGTTPRPTYELTCSEIKRARMSPISVTDWPG